MKQVSTAQDASDLLAQVDTFLLDCDGVLWHGNDLIPGIKETLSYLRSQKKRLVFVTNNSTKSRRSYLEKFQKLGIDATFEDIFGSSYAAAYYLKYVQHLAADKKVYVVGSGGIGDELRELGIPYDMDEDGEHMDNFTFDDVHPDNSYGAVVIGFDLHFNYKKLAKAHCYLRYNDPPCLYYATNTDATYPMGDRLYPGTGTLVSALTTAIGRPPKIFGKPHAPMLDCILNKMHLDPKRTCMVGDRLDTDIAFGKHGALKTLLVLTGVTKLSDVASHAEQERPDYVAESFAKLLETDN